VSTLRRIYEGPRNQRTGEQIFPGFAPGLENAPGSSLIAPASPGEFSFGDTYFGQVLFERSDWDFRTLDFDRDIALSDRKAARIIDATSPDLRSFRAHGGKLIQYHGWSDALMPAAGSIAYYDSVRAFMAEYPDPRTANAASIDGFYRLFMIPGMGHCYGGAGPTSIVPDDDRAPPDPKHDLLSALDLWVEKGIAPEMFIGSGKVPGDPGKTMSRPICRYPNITRYRDRGDTNVATSFECATPPDRGGNAAFPKTGQTGVADGAKP
jgi:feruloyl esterase